jgi:uncharacterized protein DUF3560
MNHYEEKQERRRERLLNRADRLRNEAHSRFQAARASVQHIPPGQPILVGHHSERRHRRDLEKHDNNMRKGIAADEAAKEAARRAEGVGSAGISSDDPEAGGKIKERIEELEALQTKMAATNKCIRRNDDAGLTALGYTDKQIGQLKTPDFAGRIGFPAYALSNNSANIRRLKQRLAEVVKNATRESARYQAGPGIEIVENAEINRLQIVFAEKPDVDVRQKLKRNGFRWSPSEGAWQRQLSGGARYAAEYALGVKL